MILSNIKKIGAVLSIIAFIMIIVYALFVIDKYKKQHAADLVTISNNISTINNLEDSSKNMNKLLKDLESKNGEQAKLIAYYKSSGAKIEEIGVTKAEIKKTVERKSNDSAIHKKPSTDNITDTAEIEKRKKLEYDFTKIYAKDSNGTPLLMAWAMLFPNETDPAKRWRTGSYPIEFNHTVIETENKDGTFNRSVEVHITNNTNAETKNREYPITVTDLKWEHVDVKDKTFFLFNPRIGIGANFTRVATPKIDLSLMSYGRTKVDMDWRFLTLGIGYHKNSDYNTITASFEPVSWNVGKVLPVINNLFIGPEITYDVEHSSSYGVSLSVPF